MKRLIRDFLIALKIIIGSIIEVFSILFLIVGSIVLITSIFVGFSLREIWNAYYQTALHFPYVWILSLGAIYEIIYPKSVLHDAIRSIKEVLKEDIML